MKRAVNRLVIASAGGGRCDTSSSRSDATRSRAGDLLARQVVRRYQQTHLEPPAARVPTPPPRPEPFAGADQLSSVHGGCPDLQSGEGHDRQPVSAGRVPQPMTTDPGTAALSPGRVDQRQDCRRSRPWLQPPGSAPTCQLRVFRIDAPDYSRPWKIRLRETGSCHEFVEPTPRRCGWRRGHSGPMDGGSSESAHGPQACSCRRDPRYRSPQLRRRGARDHLARGRVQTPLSPGGI